MNSSDLYKIIENQYPKPNYVCLPEVRDATGFDAVRTADAIAIGLYRSCGRLIHGFEIKVSRSDWIKELSNASKAESLMRYCHRWTLVTPSEKIVDGVDEIPQSWGWAIPYQKRSNATMRLKWIKPAPDLTPSPYSMIFITALIYAHGAACRAEEAPMRRAEYDRGKKDAETTFNLTSHGEELAKLKAAVDAFESSSGISISSWTSENSANKMGQLFRDWQKSENTEASSIKKLEMIQKQAEQVHRAITNILTLGDKMTWEQREGLK